MFEGQDMQTSPHFVLTDEMRSLFEQFNTSNLSEVKLREVPAGKKVSILTTSWSVYEITLDDLTVTVNPLYSQVVPGASLFEVRPSWLLAAGVIERGSRFDIPHGMTTNVVAAILVH